MSLQEIHIYSSTKTDNCRCSLPRVKVAETIAYCLASRLCPTRMVLIQSCYIKPFVRNTYWRHTEQSENNAVQRLRKSWDSEIDWFPRTQRLKAHNWLEYRHDQTMNYRFDRMTDDSCLQKILEVTLAGFGMGTPESDRTTSRDRGRERHQESDADTRVMPMASANWSKLLPESWTVSNKWDQSVVRLPSYTWTSGKIHR